MSSPQRSTSPSERPIPPEFADPDPLLSPSYKLLSDRPRAPAARLMGKPRGPRDLDMPGPGEYDPEGFIDKRAPKIISNRTLRLKEAEVLDVPYYHPVIEKPKGRGPKIMDSRTDGPRVARKVEPGPGAYDHGDTFKTKIVSQSCTFGGPHKSSTNYKFPGPGAYEASDGAPAGGGGISRRALNSMTATGSLGTKQPTEPRTGSGARSGVPGPGTYDLGSTFGPKSYGVYGQCLPSIKGRLPHPMDDKNASHECAKTSSPRNQQMKMRASPRGY